MDGSWEVQWLLRLQEHINEAEQTPPGPAGRVPISHYNNEAHAEAERRCLFREYAVPIAHVSEFEGAGSFVTIDVVGVPILAVRGKDGELRAFLNVCRHRGTRLALARAGRSKGFVCGYHGWTYDLAGALIHVPHRDAFGHLACDGLVELPLRVTAGLVWVTPSPAAAPRVDAELGSFEQELDAFGLAAHRVHRRIDEERACNWKLVIEAFLEGYHVRTLHRDSIYRFFLDRAPILELCGPHTRAIGARRSLKELADRPRDTWRVREHATVFYFLFPNTVIVMHPDWCSLISMYPKGVERSRYVHTMLVPSESKRDDAYWERTWGLIEEKVFQVEDLRAAESIQSTMDSGADTHFRTGTMEYSIAHFHESIERAIGAHDRAV